MKTEIFSSSTLKQHIKAALVLSAFSVVYTRAVFISLFTSFDGEASLFDLLEYFMWAGFFLEIIGFAVLIKLFDWNNLSQLLVTTFFSSIFLYACAPVVFRLLAFDGINIAYEEFFFPTLSTNAIYSMFLIWFLAFFCAQLLCYFCFSLLIRGRFILSLLNNSRQAKKI